MQAYDANGRQSYINYQTTTLRPEYEFAPTGAYNYHIYDDANLIVYDFAYEANKSGEDFAARSDKYIEGHGRVHGEVAYGKDYVLDLVNTKFDNLGRLWQQTRPYRYGGTAQWYSYFYDQLDRVYQVTAPDGSAVSRWYNYTPEPVGSSGQPGQTIWSADPWGRERWVRYDA